MEQTSGVESAGMDLRHMMQQKTVWISQAYLPQRGAPRTYYRQGIPCNTTLHKIVVVCRTSAPMGVPPPIVGQRLKELVK